MPLYLWIVFLLLALLALATTTYAYLRREPAIGGRKLLIALRAGTLLVLLLLLFDPAAGLIRGDSGGSDAPAVLLDASLSMSLPVHPDSSTTRWERALPFAHVIAGSGSVVLFGDRPAVVSADSLADHFPGSIDSRLYPALRTVLEAGASRATVIGDGELEDLAAVERWLAREGVPVEFRDPVAPALPDFALVAADGPEWVEEGEEVRVRAEIAASGWVESPGQRERPDSVTLRVFEGQRVRAVERVETPPDGRVVLATLEFSARAPAGGGLVRYDIRIESEDAIPDDDVRSVYVRVSEDPQGVVLISFRPDWEPRFLLPVLARSTGLPARGYLRLANGSYLSLRSGADERAAVQESAIRAAAASADLLVLHGIGDGAPAWARALSGSASRVLMFPAADAPEAVLPVSLPPPAAGEWYADDDLPSSPIVGLLAGFETDSLPPLSGVRPSTAGEGTWSPLRVRRGRSGPPAAALLAGEEAGRRWSVVNGTGFWRWAFRPGAPRRAYRQLWSGVAGWLLEDGAAATAEALQPLRRSIPRGERLQWAVADAGADSIEVALQPQTGVDSSGRADTAALEPAGAAGAESRGATGPWRIPVREGVATGPVVPPGHYTYRGRVFAGGAATDSAGGALTVERYSPEFARPRGDLPERTEELAGASAGPFDGSTRAARLHTSVWPYLLLILLLCAEWTLRRRWGLR